MFHMVFRMWAAGYQLRETTAGDSAWSVSATRGNFVSSFLIWKNPIFWFFYFLFSLKVEMVGTPKAFKFPPWRHDLCGFDKQPFLGWG